jgi:phosphoribosylanthranilate isomerase
MSLNTFVYIRDVDNLSDARYCAGMGVDMIGFRLDPGHENYLDTSKFKEISDWISGVKIVGEFGTLTSEELKDILTQYKLDYILTSDISQLDDYKKLDFPLIVKLDVEAITDELTTELNFRTGSFDYLLIDSSDKTISENHKEVISQIASQHPVLLGYGFNEHDASELVTALGTEGISMTGSSEIRPGFKDYDQLADILESLEVD